MILAQIDAVVGDIGVDAVKIGMIGGAFAAEQVAGRLERLQGRAARPADRVRSGHGRDQRSACLPTTRRSRRSAG